jgi:hypothetical protein
VAAGFNQQNMFYQNFNSSARFFGSKSTVNNSGIMAFKNTLLRRPSCTRVILNRREITVFIV